MNHTISKRLIAGLLAGLFLMQEAGFAALEIKPQTSIKPAEFTLPKDVAVIKEVSAIQGVPETILNIKDVHDNLSAQESIVHILESLVANYEVKTIGVEGMEGAVDVSLLKALPDAAMKKNTAEYLLKEGRISAAEFFASINNAKVAVYGMDDDADYRENLTAFKKILSSREANGGRVTLLEEHLSQLESNIFSSELRLLNQNGVIRQNGQAKFSQKWRSISVLASKYGVRHDRHDNLNRLLDCIEKEKTLNFEVAAEQRQTLLDLLKDKLAKEDLETLVAKGVEYKLGKITAGSFSSYILEKSIAYGVNIGEYRDLKVYSDYLALYESIDVEALKDEITLFEDQIREKIFRNDDERKLYTLIKHAGIIRDLFDVKLTSASLAYYRENKAHFTPAEYEDFFKAISLREGTETPSIPLKAIFGALPEAALFYETAEKRNQALLDNTVRRMRENGETIGCLITGGFHSRGITELMKQRGASYVVIVPRFQNNSKRPYVAILTNTENSYADFLNSQLVVDTKIQATTHYFGQVAYSAAAKDPYNLQKASASVKKAVEEAKKAYQFAYSSGNSPAEKLSMASSSPPNGLSAAGAEYIAPRAMLQGGPIAMDMNVHLIGVSPMPDGVRAEMIFEFPSMEAAVQVTVDGSQIRLSDVQRGASYTQLIDKISPVVTGVSPPIVTPPVFDFGIASDNAAGTTRHAHEAFHQKGEFSVVMAAIAQSLGFTADANGMFDFKGAVERNGGRIETEYGELRMELDGILVVIDSRFQADHAGRGQQVVYASSEAKAQHELTELRSWNNFAVEKGIATREQIKNGELGALLRDYMNLNKENEIEILTTLDKLHREGLLAESAWLIEHGNFNKEQRKFLNDYINGMKDKDMASFQAAVGNLNGLFEYFGKPAFTKDSARQFLADYFGVELDAVIPIGEGGQKFAYRIGDKVYRVYKNAAAEFGARMGIKSEAELSGLIENDRIVARIEDVHGQPFDAAEFLLPLDKAMEMAKERGDESLLERLEEAKAANPLASEYIIEQKNKNLGLAVRQEADGSLNVYVVGMDIIDMNDSISKDGLAEILEKIKNATPKPVSFENVEKAIPEIHDIRDKQIDADTSEKESAQSYKDFIISSAAPPPLSVPAVTLMKPTMEVRADLFDEISALQGALAEEDLGKSHKLIQNLIEKLENDEGNLESTGNDKLDKEIKKVRDQFHLLPLTLVQEQQGAALASNKDTLDEMREALAKSKKSHIRLSGQKNVLHRRIIEHAVIQADERAAKSIDAELLKDAIRKNKDLEILELGGGTRLYRKAVEKRLTEVDKDAAKRLLRNAVKDTDQYKKLSEKIAQGELFIDGVFRGALIKESGLFELHNLIQLKSLDLLQKMTQMYEQITGRSPDVVSVPDMAAAVKNYLSSSTPAEIQRSFLEMMKIKGHLLDWVRLQKMLLKSETLSASEKRQLKSEIQRVMKQIRGFSSEFTEIYMRRSMEGYQEAQRTLSAESDASLIGQRVELNEISVRTLESILTLDFEPQMAELRLLFGELAEVRAELARLQVDYRLLQAEGRENSARGRKIDGQIMLLEEQLARGVGRNRSLSGISQEIQRLAYESYKSEKKESDIHVEWRQDEIEGRVISALVENGVDIQADVIREWYASKMYRPGPVQSALHRRAQQEKRNLKKRISYRTLNLQSEERVLRHQSIQNNRFGSGKDIENVRKFQAAWTLNKINMFDRQIYLIESILEKIEERTFGEKDLDTIEDKIFSAKELREILFDDVSVGFKGRALEQDALGRLKSKLNQALKEQTTERNVAELLYTGGGQIEIEKDLGEGLHSLIVEANSRYLEIRMRQSSYKDLLSFQKASAAAAKSLSEALTQRLDNEISFVEWAAMKGYLNPYEIFQVVDAAGNVLSKSELQEMNWSFEVISTPSGAKVSRLVNIQSKREVSDAELASLGWRDMSRTVEKESVEHLSKLFLALNAKEEDSLREHLGGTELPPSVLEDKAEEILQPYRQARRDTLKEVMELSGDISMDELMRAYKESRRDTGKFKRMQARAKEMFELEMAVPISGEMTSEERNERLARSMAMVELLNEMSNAEFSLSYSQQMMIFTMLEGMNSGVATGGRKTATNVLGNVMYRLMYGTNYRGVMLVENGDAVLNYTSDKEIQKMQEISGFNLLEFGGREQSKDTTAKLLDSSDGMLILDYTSWSFLHLDAQTAAAEGDLNLMQAMQVHFGTLDELHLFLTATQSAIIATDTQKGEEDKTRYIKGLIDKLTVFRNGTLQLQYYVHKVEHEEEDTKVWDEILKEEPNAPMIYYNVKNKKIMLSPMLENIIQKDWGSDTAAVEQTIRGILAPRKGEDGYDVQPDRDGEFAIVPYNIYSGPQVNSSFQQLAFQTAIAIKHTIETLGGEYDNAAASLLVRKSRTSNQTALARSIRVPGAIMVGATGTLAGLEDSAYVQMGNRSRNISTSKWDDRLKTRGQISIQGRLKIAYQTKLDDIWNEALKSLKGTDASGNLTGDPSKIARAGRSVGLMISINDPKTIEEFIERAEKAGISVVTIDAERTEEEMKEIVDNPQANGDPRLIIITERGMVGRDFKTIERLEHFSEKVGIDLGFVNADKLSLSLFLQAVGRAGRSGAEPNTIRFVHVDASLLAKGLRDLTNDQKGKDFRNLLWQKLSQDSKDVSEVLGILNKLESNQDILSRMFQEGWSDDIASLWMESDLTLEDLLRLNATYLEFSKVTTRGANFNIQDNGRTILVLDIFQDIQMQGLAGKKGGYYHLAAIERLKRLYSRESPYASLSYRAGRKASPLGMVGDTTRAYLRELKEALQDVYSLHRSDESWREAYFGRNASTGEINRVPKQLFHRLTQMARDYRAAMVIRNMIKEVEAIEKLYPSSAFETLEGMGKKVAEMMELRLRGRTTKASYFTISPADTLTERTEKFVRSSLALAERNMMSSDQEQGFRGEIRNQKADISVKAQGDHPAQNVEAEVEKITRNGESVSIVFKDTTRLSSVLRENELEVAFSRTADGSLVLRAANQEHDELAQFSIVIPATPEILSMFADYDEGRPVGSLRLNKESGKREVHLSPPNITSASTVDHIAAEWMMTKELGRQTVAAILNTPEALSGNLDLRELADLLSRRRGRAVSAHDLMMELRHGLGLIATVTQGDAKDMKPFRLAGGDDDRDILRRMGPDLLEQQSGSKDSFTYGADIRQIRLALRLADAALNNEQLAVSLSGIVRPEIIQWMILRLSMLSQNQTRNEAFDTLRSEMIGLVLQNEIDQKEKNRLLHGINKLKDELDRRKLAKSLGSFDIHSRVWTTRVLTAGETSLYDLLVGAHVLDGDNEEGVAALAFSIKEWDAIQRKPLNFIARKIASLKGQNPDVEAINSNLKKKMQEAEGLKTVVAFREAVASRIDEINTWADMENATQDILLALKVSGDDIQTKIAREIFSQKGLGPVSASMVEEINRVRLSLAVSLQEVYQAEMAKEAAAKAFHVVNDKLSLRDLLKFLKAEELLKKEEKKDLEALGRVMLKAEFSTDSDITLFLMLTKGLSSETLEIYRSQMSFVDKAILTNSKDAGALDPMTILTQFGGQLKRIYDRVLGANLLSHYGIDQLPDMALGRGVAAASFPKAEAVVQRLLEGFTNPEIIKKKLEQTFIEVDLTLSETDADSIKREIYSKLAESLAASAKDILSLEEAVTYNEKALQGIEPAKDDVRQRLSALYEKMASLSEGASRMIYLEKAWKAARYLSSEQRLHSQLQSEYMALADSEADAILQFIYRTKAKELGAVVNVDGQVAAGMQLDELLKTMRGQAATHRVDVALSGVAHYLVILQELGLDYLLESRRFFMPIADEFSKIYHEHYMPSIPVNNGFTESLQRGALASLYYSLSQKIGQEVYLTDGREAERLKHYKTVVLGQKPDRDFFAEDGHKKLQRLAIEKKMKFDSSSLAGLTLPLRNNPGEAEEVRESLAKYFNEEIQKISGKEAEKLQKLLTPALVEKLAHGLAVNIDTGSMTRQETMRKIDRELKTIIEFLQDEYYVDASEVSQDFREGVVKPAMEGVRSMRRKALFFLGDRAENQFSPEIDPAILYVKKSAIKNKDEFKNALTFFLEGAGIVVIPVDDDSKQPSERLKVALIAHEFLHATFADFAHHDIREGIVTYLAAQIAKENGDSDGAAHQLAGLYPRARATLDRWMESGITEEQLVAGLLTGSMAEIGVYGIREAIHALQTIGNLTHVMIAGAAVALSELTARFGDFQSDDAGTIPIYVQLKRDTQGNVHLAPSPDKNELETELRRFSPFSIEIEKAQNHVFWAQIAPTFFENYGEGYSTYSQEKDLLNAAFRISTELGVEIMGLLNLKDKKVDGRNASKLARHVNNLNNGYLKAMDLQVNAEFNAENGRLFVNGFLITERRTKIILLKSGEERRIDLLFLTKAHIDIDNNSRESAINRTGEDHISVFRDKLLEWTAENMHPIASGESGELLAALQRDMKSFAKGEEGKIFKLDEFGMLQFVDISATTVSYPQAAGLLSQLNQRLWSRPITSGNYRQERAVYLGGHPEMRRAVMNRLEHVVSEMAEQTEDEKNLLNKSRKIREKFGTKQKASATDIALHAGETVLGAHEKRHKTDDYNGQQYSDQFGREMPAHSDSIHDPDAEGAETFAVYQMYGYADKGNTGFEYKRVAADQLAFMTSRWQRTLTRLGIKRPSRYSQRLLASDKNALKTFRRRISKLSSEQIVKFARERSALFETEIQGKKVSVKDIEDYQAAVKEASVAVPPSKPSPPPPAPGPGAPLGARLTPLETSRFFGGDDDKKIITVEPKQDGARLARSTEQPNLLVGIVGGDEKILKALKTEFPLVKFVAITGGSESDHLAQLLSSDPNNRVPTHLLVDIGEEITKPDAIARLGAVLRPALDDAERRAFQMDYPSLAGLETSRIEDLDLSRPLLKRMVDDLNKAISKTGVTIPSAEFILSDESGVSLPSVAVKPSDTENWVSHYVEKLETYQALQQSSGSPERQDSEKEMALLRSHFNAYLGENAGDVERTLALHEITAVSQKIERQLFTWLASGGMESGEYEMVFDVRSAGGYPADKVAPFLERLLRQTKALETSGVTMRIKLLADIGQESEDFQKFDVLRVSPADYSSPLSPSNVVVVTPESNSAIISLQLEKGQESEAERRNFVLTGEDIEHAERLTPTLAFMTLIKRHQMKESKSLVVLAGAPQAAQFFSGEKFKDSLQLIQLTRYNIMKAIGEFMRTLRNIEVSA